MSAHSDPADLPDAELIGRILTGERTHYAEVIRRYQARLRAAVSYHLHGPDEIEEFLQETFVQAYLHLERYDARAPFFPWLKGIALNALRMEFRRLSTSRRRGEDYLRHVRLSQVEDENAGDEGEVQAGALRTCLERLPAAEAELVRVKYAEGRPLRELAARYQASEGALKLRLLRLRAILRDCILKRLARERHA